MIGDGSDPERVAKAAHKALPLLEMLEPGKNAWVAPLQTSGGALVSSAPILQPGGAPTKQQYSQSEVKSILVGALLALASGESRAETSAPPGETTAPPEETTAPPNEQERERLTKQLIEKLKEILCDIY